MKRNFNKSFIASLVMTVFATSAFAGEQPPEFDFDQGYLDTFTLTDTRVIDIGENGGGTEAGINENKITVAPQDFSVASDGRLTGKVNGKLFVQYMSDGNGDFSFNGPDVDKLFDVTWNLVRFQKSDPQGTAEFVTGLNNGTESGSAPPWVPGFDADTPNFAPNSGGTGSIWNIASCNAGQTVVPGGSEDEICTDPFNAGLSVFSSNWDATFGFYSGWVDYAFDVSIPFGNDFTPGLVPSEDYNYVITAVLWKYK